MEIKRRYELVELLKHFNLPLVGVELGVAGGSFSHELLSHGMDKLFSIDLWEQQEGVGDKSFPNHNFHYPNYESTKELLSEFGEKSVIIRALTTEAVKQFEDESLSLVYNDADHGDAVYKDIEDWWTKLVKGGIMAFHDYDNEGYSIKKAVEEFAEQNNLEIHFIPETSIGDSGAWVRKH